MPKMVSQKSIKEFKVLICEIKRLMKFDNGKIRLANTFLNEGETLNLILDMLRYSESEKRRITQNERFNIYDTTRANFEREAIDIAVDYLTRRKNVLTELKR